MAHTIFFSWQADRPTKEGRNLVERALEAAAARVVEDTTVEEPTRDIAVDRDTAGVPGSPPIVDTILKKIDQAALFVPDLTFVAQRPDGRPSPNPNVLIEYGWALKTLGHSRILPVMNTAYGEPRTDNMPFDLAHLRFPIAYNCAEGADDEKRRAAKQELTKKLENALKAYFQSEAFKQSLQKPPPPPAFMPREARNGQGRFRDEGTPIGVSDDTFSLNTATEVLLKDGPALWLRVMPSVHPGRQWLMTELRAASSPQHGGKLLMPLLTRAGSYDHVRSEDGYGCYGVEKDPKLTNSLVFAFSTGEVWGVDTLLLTLGDQTRKVIPNVLDLLANGLDAYSDFVSRLGAPGPYKWIAGMEDLKGRALALIPPPAGSLTFPIQGSCVSESVVAEGLHNRGDTAAESLRPFFAKLYDSCGMTLPEWYGR